MTPIHLSYAKLKIRNPLDGFPHSGPPPQVGHKPPKLAPKDPKGGHVGAKRRPRGSNMSQVGSNMTHRTRKARKAKTLKNQRFLLVFEPPGELRWRQDCSKAIILDEVGARKLQVGCQVEARWYKPASRWKPDGVSRPPGGSQVVQAGFQEAAHRPELA